MRATGTMQSQKQKDEKTAGKLQESSSSSCYTVFSQCEIYGLSEQTSAGLPLLSDVFSVLYPLLDLLEAKTANCPSSQYFRKKSYKSSKLSKGSKDCVTQSLLCCCFILSSTTRLFSSPFEVLCTSALKKTY